MKKWKVALIGMASTLLAGCGDEDFTGAYRLQAPKNVAVVLNILRDEADIFMEKGAEARIEPIGKMKVSVKGEKLFLDDVNSNDRWVMKRNVDERSLDCLNCEVLNLKDTVHWKYDPKGPYDVTQMLKEQARKDEEEVAKLSTYEGSVAHVVNACVQKGVSREICACTPQKLKKMGFSEAEFIKFSKSNFKPSGQEELWRYTEYGNSVRSAAMQCVTAQR